MAETDSTAPTLEKVGEDVASAAGEAWEEFAQDPVGTVAEGLGGLVGAGQRTVDEIGKIPGTAADGLRKLGGDITEGVTGTLRAIGEEGARIGGKFEEGRQSGYGTDSEADTQSDTDMSATSACLSRDTDVSELLKSPSIDIDVSSIASGPLAARVSGISPLMRKYGTGGIHDMGTNPLKSISFDPSSVSLCSADANKSADDELSCG